MDHSVTELVTLVDLTAGSHIPFLIPIPFYFMVLDIQEHKTSDIEFPFLK